MKTNDERSKEDNKALDGIEGARNGRQAERDRLMGFDFLMAEMHRDLSLLADEMSGLIAQQDRETLARYVERHPEERELIFGDEPAAGPATPDRGEGGRQAEEREPER
ncbi:hypothetical protein HQ865_22805 [Mucilaginibacter mali]|uniref:Uncharacterized protein n=1 Tax=Mucilaginibacter mali TaxID=2740462 RepID=A0A7D4TQ89_9SPHI|nr:hypothetical protein [Mucilaginibacter mali]QKJ32473.1 hypothetical protein HQ865_22805 [Mucilaginibacter mali]